jgi:hypothetical protein
MDGWTTEQTGLCDRCNDVYNGNGKIAESELCAQCHAKFDNHEMPGTLDDYTGRNDHRNTIEATGTSAKVLRVMSMIPNGDLVGLCNLETGAVTFLGRAEITTNPTLYDDAMTQGEVACCFWRMTNDGLQPNGNVGFTCHISVCPGFEKLEAELKEHVRAYCETTFECIPTLKN